MSEILLTPIDLSQQKKLRILYIANDAPNSSDEESAENHYNTSYHNEIFLILKDLGLHVWSTRNVQELIAESRNYNYVFTLLNRLNFDNSEVFVPSLCEYLGLKYLGAKPNIRALAEDKHLTKMLAKNIGIPTSDWLLIRHEDHEYYEPPFKGPYFIKWRYGASSIEISEENCVNDWHSAIERIKYFQIQKKDVIVERLLLGDSITVPVISSQYPFTLSPVITYSNKPYGIVTYEQARYLEEGIYREIYQNQIIAEKVKMYSKKLFEAIAPVDYIRVDFKVDKYSDEPQLLEFNICCNISSKSSICLSAAEKGISQQQLISHIINQSLVRQGF